MEQTTRILLVEDSETQALQFCHAIEEVGLKVDHVSSAEQALEYLSQRLPSLLVTDYHLPAMSGDELCRKIRMNVAARGIPILMLTGDQAGEIERHVLESGADVYVSKSEDSDFLLLRIQALLRKAQVQRVMGVGTAGITPASLLIVESNPAYQKRLETELATEGYKIKTASSGAAALKRLALEMFDGVVLDLALSDMNGSDACARFIGARRTLDHSFVVLALTESKAKGHMTEVLAAGADDVVAKSRDIAVIKARLRALIRRRLLAEENRHIAAEFQKRELEILRVRAEKEAADVRAAMAGELRKANLELEATNRRLKDAQSQLVQSAKMASLGQLVAGIAHEINNPLAFVMSHQTTVERILEALTAQLESHLAQASLGQWNKARQRLRDMQDGMDRIRDLVLKLRTFSRLDEGEYKDVKIEDGIESVLTLLHHRLKNRIQITRKYGNIKTVSCYPGPLNQVIMNVIANAIDAIEGKGEISISTGLSDSMFFISIADTGKGMSAEIRERIFEPFFTTKPVGEGTGLGLSISYGIIQKHKGQIEIHSEVGRGSEVIIKIPMTPVTETSDV